MSSGVQAANCNSSQDGVRTTAEYIDPAAPSPSTGARWAHNISGIDGALVTVGKIADAAVPSGDGTVIAILKAVRDKLANAAATTSYTPLKIQPRQLKTSTDIVSASYSAGTSNLADVDTQEYKDILVIINTTAISGSVTVTWQVKTGTVYADHTALASFNTTGVRCLKITAPVGKTGRVSLSVGTSMTAAFEIIGE